MNFGAIFLVYSLLSVFGFVVAVYLTYMLDSFLNGHDLPTSRKARKLIKKIIEEHNPGAKNLYDLGCSRGEFAIGMKYLLPRVDIIGIDTSALRILFARVASFLWRKKVVFRRANIFDEDLTYADVVYTYLWYDRMPPLEKKLLQELKSGAIVITNTSHFLTWQPVGVYATHPASKWLSPEFENLFVYKK